MRRINADIKKLLARGYSVNAADLSNVIVEVPLNSIYKKNILSFDLRNFPFAAPEMRILSKCRHPNVKGGKMCLDILTKWQGSTTLEGIIDAFAFTLDHPNLDSPLDADAAREWVANYAEFAKTAH